MHERLTVQHPAHMHQKETVTLINDECLLTLSVELFDFRKLISRDKNDLYFFFSFLFLERNSKQVSMSKNGSKQTYILMMK